jgi:RNA polymerase sigma-70 factor, ECF subfamily
MSQRSAKLRLVRVGEAVRTAVKARPALDSDPVVTVSDDDVTPAALAVLPDESLVVLATRGDMRAAESLYRRHAAFALNLAARIAGSTHDVEDVVHDAFLRAFDRLGSLREPKAFRTWLGSIVVHGMRSRLRRTRLLRVLGLGGADPVDIEHIASEDASPRVRAELAQLYALLKTLSADDRIAWTLRFVEGHDLRAAAELCGCSLATIKRRIRRAQRHIEEHYVGAPIESSPGMVLDGEDEDPPVSAPRPRTARGEEKP